MFSFEIASTEGHLGAKAVTAGNTEKHAADFQWFLDKGVILTSVTATVTSGSISGATLSSNRKTAIWFFTAVESTTLTLTVTTNDGQTLVYTVEYQVA